MNDVYLKDEFEQWMSEQIQDNKKPYAQETQKGYSYALKKACNEIKSLNLSSGDLFSIDSLDEFKSIEARIRENNDFERVNKKFGKGQLSAGMIRYAKFLDERNRASTVAWFVGAVISGEDQMQRFIDEGIWENGYDDKYIDKVNSIKVGDRIAIKSTYTRKHDLPFDNKGNVVSVMGIKAIGTVTNNFNDGHKVSVNWEVLDDIKEWYFFTGRWTIWSINEKDGWMNKNLIDFTFNNSEQDINRFVNDPGWKEKFGDIIDEQYEWTNFYQASAKELLKYKNKRSELLDGISEIFNKIKMKNPLMKKNHDGTDQVLEDVCPFTVFGLFNKGITNNNRKLIMVELANFLGVEEKVPSSFEGIPVLNNMKAWFFGDEAHRSETDIDNLWQLFENAICLAEDYTEENKEAFIEIYDKVIEQHGIQWNFSFGLYWIKPWEYISLDGYSRNYLSDELKVKLKCSSRKKIPTGEEYLELVEILKENFEVEEYPVHSFPELSYKAWSNEEEVNIEETYSEDEEDGEITYESYTKDDFLSQVFINEKSYETIKSLLKRKKNLILQGAPGVGKTFVAKRLAFSIMEIKDTSRVKLVQFHQSYAYEDFIMGYRPNGVGFELKEGPFYEFCELASKKENQGKDFYFIIDEINRGNLSKIFGELLMLIESDKRGEEITLTYSNKPFHVPENLYIIGMMNTADRSLAIIDYALRRRFCFFELEPAYNTETFKNHLLKQGASEELINHIKNKINNINTEIEKDNNLGKGFRIGHSYFCDYEDSEQWYEEVIKYEIEPLIREYWFDEEEKAKKLIEELLGD